MKLLVNKIIYPVENFTTTQTINETDITWTTTNGTSKLTVYFESGVGADIDVFENQLTIQVTSSESFENKTMGLLGVNNNDINDDFTRPDGTQISINSTQSSIYYQFGTLCKYLLFKIFLYEFDCLSAMNFQNFLSFYLIKKSSMDHLHCKVALLLMVETAKEF